MHIQSYDSNNIEFLKSMERRRNLPRWLTILCAVSASIVLLMAPDAQAKSKLSEADRAQLIEDLSMQVAAALPYQDARQGAMDTLTIRGELPAMWRVELIEPTSWRTTRVQGKIFDVEHPDRPAAFVQVNFSVEIPVYQASARIEAGQAIDASLVTQKYVTLYEAPHDAITSMDDLMDKVARRSLSPGKIVGKNVLDDPVIFKRGDVIHIRVRRGNVELVDTGLALETGKLNQTVRVKSTSTDAVLSGLVRRDGVVF